MTCYKRIGEMLVERGVIGAEELEALIEEQERTGARLGEIALARGIVFEEQIAACLAEQYQMPLVDVQNLKPAAKALRLISPNFALAHLILPLSVEGETLVVAVGDPIDLVATDELALRLQRPVRVVVAPPSTLEDAIYQAYKLVDKPSSRRKERDREADGQGKAMLLLLLNNEAGWVENRKAA